jgi:curli biogenesis system outer membrane secretion channel CsgG
MERAMTIDVPSPGAGDCSRQAGLSNLDARCPRAALPENLMQLARASSERPVKGLAAAATLALLALCPASVPLCAAAAPAAAPAKIAVFDFELDDLTPAAAYNHKPTSSAESMDKVSSAARSELAQSGRYSIVDVSTADAKAAKDRTLRNCDGCEAGIALALGAQQSLLGIVRRATQTDYYVAIVIRDARTGKVLDEQEANFAGDESGWPTGVRMLIKHQILAVPTP